MMVSINGNSRPMFPAQPLTNTAPARGLESSKRTRSTCQTQSLPGTGVNPSEGSASIHSDHSGVSRS